MLALFALALQLGLSFGHFHHDTAIAGIAASASQLQASTPDNDHDQNTAHRELCAICATVAMANTLVTTAAPSLPVPLAITALRTGSYPEAFTADSRRAAFRSRAPPRSSLE